MGEWTNLERVEFGNRLLFYFSAVGVVFYFSVFILSGLNMRDTLWFSTAVYGLPIFLLASVACLDGKIFRNEKTHRNRNRIRILGLEPA